MFNTGRWLSVLISKFYTFQISILALLLFPLLQLLLRTDYAAHLWRHLFPCLPAVAQSLPHLLLHLANSLCPQSRDKMIPLTQTLSREFTIPIFKKYMILFTHVSYSSFILPQLLQGIHYRICKSIQRLGQSSAHTYFLPTPNQERVRIFKIKFLLIPYYHRLSYTAAIIFIANRL